MRSSGTSRMIQCSGELTGVGPVAMRQPRVRDRGAATNARDRIRFTPTILPPYARRSKGLGVLLPILCPKDISTGGFSEALADKDEKQCILVLISATLEGKKELIDFTDGARESAQDRRRL